MNFFFQSKKKTNFFFLKIKYKAKQNEIASRPGLLGAHWAGDCSFEQPEENKIRAIRIPLS